MKSSTKPLIETRPAGSGLAEQAHPGHGIPSQNPAAAAQYALSPEEAERESKSSLMGGGVMAGTAAGAAVGAAVAGPVGVFVCGTVGAVAGALGGAAAGSLAAPDDREGDDPIGNEAEKTPNTVLPR